MEQVAAEPDAFERDQHFRIFFWQKFIPLLAIPVLAAPLAVSPLTNGWSTTSWAVAGGIIGIAVAAYLLNAWRRSDVILRPEAMTLWIGSAPESWAYEKLLKVRQGGQSRVRMCFDVDRDDGQHMHVTVDMFDSDAFTDALLDRFAASQGYELDGDALHAAA
jgi:hypothetical protein